MSRALFSKLHVIERKYRPMRRKKAISSFWVALEGNPRPSVEIERTFEILYAQSNHPEIWSHEETQVSRVV